MLGLVGVWRVALGGGLARGVECWVVDGAGAPLAAAVRGAARAVPLWLVATLWYTRLQHERDVVGMVIYEVEQIGIDVPARGEQGRVYQEHFGIPDGPW